MVSVVQPFQDAAREMVRMGRAAMAAGHDLKGLMKFLDREEWQEPFDEVCEEHFGVVLAAASIEFEDLAAKRGDIANALWWCAFEDFLTRSFAVEGNQD